MISDIPLWQLPPALDALAEELGIVSGDLDEAVLEAAHNQAADAYNNGSYAELGDDAAYDHVHNSADERASAVNSSITDQLSFLADGCASEQALRSLLTDQLGCTPIPRLPEEMIA